MSSLQVPLSVIKKKSRIIPEANDWVIVKYLKSDECALVVNDIQSLN